ncbi:N-formylglutamate amidohydrolase [Stappia stellulata]|uniref:N-formylglutamate amidohydrolase n=1 Tax=Stappia stellulata TaxID=71235 RepID=UPI0003F7E97F|nr:N-formylglutamate amidohydrolase [Stappia stellulata]
MNVPVCLPPAPDPDLSAVERLPGAPDSGLLILCDHAGNAVPRAYGTLGLPEAAFQRHIAYDIGVRALTFALARALNAPAVLSTFSRLLIDPNRGEDDPTLVMRLSDGAVVPGNADHDAAERERRLAAYHRPYHAAIAEQIDAAIGAGHPPAILSVHSFTPVWRGVPRPWHAGVLWDNDPRFARPLLERLRECPDLVVGDNEPYDGALKNDCMYRHGTVRGLAHALLEVRQDLIGDAAGVAEWADRLVPLLRQLLETFPGLGEIRHHGSRSA